MQRNTFNLSHTKLATFDMGQLVPVGLQEILPGDSIVQNSTALIRLPALNAPVMHPVVARIDHFFVPHRLIWSDWENFITGGPDGNNASGFPTISLNTATHGRGTLANYLGVPNNTGTYPVSALPFRGYALIWNEWFRDQDLNPALTIDLTDGVDSTTNLTLQRCCWEKDYFTTCRPWPQKGDAVTVPVGGIVPVSNTGDIVLDGHDTEFRDAQNGQGQLHTLTAAPATGAVSSNRLSSTVYGWDPEQILSGAAVAAALEVDLSNAAEIDIITLRRALAIQRYQERMARTGSKYTDYLRGMGVRSPDERLQRPEYLGGGRQTVQISEVLQTAPVSGVGVGDLFGHGIGMARSNAFRAYFPEHGYVFTLMSVRPKTIYTQGLARTWNRRVKEDFFQPELQMIGQQAVQVKEVKGAASGSGGDDTFGYQDRYDEYRRTESTTAGEFSEGGTNEDWHLGREFATAPVLNAEFVTCTPSPRIYQDSGESECKVMIKHNVKAARLLQKEGRSKVV